jgi:predicted chitinase
LGKVGFHLINGGRQGLAKRLQTAKIAAQDPA